MGTFFCDYYWQQGVVDVAWTVVLAARTISEVNIAIMYSLVWDFSRWTLNTIIVVLLHGRSDSRCCIFISYAIIMELRSHFGGCYFLKTALINFTDLLKSLDHLFWKYIPRLEFVIVCMHLIIHSVYFVLSPSLLVLHKS